MCDGWTIGKGKSLTNFLVDISSETIYLKYIDTSNVIKDVKQYFELLDSIVEETREDNVAN